MQRRAYTSAKAMVCLASVIVAFGALNALLARDLPTSNVFSNPTNAFSDPKNAVSRVLYEPTGRSVEADRDSWDEKSKYLVISEQAPAKLRWSDVPFTSVCTIVLTLFAEKPVLSFSLELCVDSSCSQAHIDFGWKGDKVCFQVLPSNATFEAILRMSANPALQQTRMAERSIKAEFYSPASVNHAVRPVLHRGLESCPSNTRAPFRPWKPSFDSYVRASSNSSKSTEKSGKLLVGMVPPRSAGYSMALLEFQKVPWRHELTLAMFLQQRNRNFGNSTQLLLCRWWLAKNVRRHFQSLKRTLRQCRIANEPIVQKDTVTFISVPPEFVNDARVLRVAIGLAKTKKPRTLEESPDSLLGEDSDDFLTFYSSEADRASHRPILAIGRNLRLLSKEESSLKGLEDTLTSLNRNLKSFGQTRTLLVISTCNEVDATLETLRTFEKVSDNFEVLVVDDHSEDDTAFQVKKLGYAVVEKPKAAGLTDTWNLAYKLALDLGDVDNLIFSNNDVLIPQGAINALVAALEEHPFVVPMTSRLGAGHNHEQSFDRACNLREEVDLAVSQPWNFEKIQRAVPIVCQTGEELLFPPSVKFGGFFFAMRLESMKKVEFDEHVLFDPQKVLFGQENSLAAALDAVGLKTPISRRSFVFHFKSRTVSKTGYKVGHLEEKNWNLSSYHQSNQNATFLTSASASGREATFLARAGIVTIVVVFDDEQKAADDFARLLRSRLKWNAKSSSRESLSLRGVDILVSMTSNLNTRLLTGAKPGLVLLAWVSSTCEQPSSANALVLFGGYDVILTDTSSCAQSFRLLQPFPHSCIHRCPSVALDTDSVTVPVESIDKFDPQSLLAVLRKHQLMPPAERGPKCYDSENKRQLCVIVRTYSKQISNLDKLLITLLGRKDSALSVRVFLVNTDPKHSKAFISRLKVLVGVINSELGYCGAHLLEYPTPDRSSFGYDATDWALELLQNGAGCTHFLFTNGDNEYQSSLIPTLEAQLDGAALVAWDFHTHHKRDKGANLIRVQLKRKFVDLGAFVVRADVVDVCGAEFLPMGPFTGELFARDWFFVEQIQVCLRERNRTDEIHLVHEALLRHN